MARRLASPKRTVAYDGTPCFLVHARVLREAREHGWRGRLNSADRRKGVAEKYGRKSQWWLYMAYWVWRLRGTNPANPPGRSTHELRSDGVAYRGPVGRPLAYWQLGLDVTDSDGLLRVLAKLGYRARRPYRSRSEWHHVNFTKNPRGRWWVRYRNRKREARRVARRIKDAKRRARRK